MDESLSKIEQFLMQIAEWKAKFLHEREWRESIEKEKKALDEKYVQIVFELGTQKRALEDLEARVKLLTAQSGNDFSSQSPQEEKHSQKTEESVKPAAEHPEKHEKSRSAPSAATRHRHHIYTNPAIYEPSEFNLHSFRYNNRRDGSVDSEEPAPYVFHHYQPDEPPDFSKRSSEELDAALDDEISSLQEGLSDPD